MTTCPDPRCVRPDVPHHDHLIVANRTRRERFGPAILYPLWVSRLTKTVVAQTWDADGTLYAASDSNPYLGRANAIAKVKRLVRA